MSRLRYLIVLIAVGFFVQGCAIHHPVADNYPQYLDNHAGEHPLPETGVAAAYELDEATREHRYEFRSAMAGMGNVWVVEMGKMLQATIDGQDFQNAFNGLNAGLEENSDKVQLRMEVINYSFESSGAHVTLRGAAYRQGEELFDNTYQHSGRTQGGKMFFGGAWAMRNAVHQSTKSAMDQILTDYLNDLRDAGVR